MSRIDELQKLLAESQEDSPGPWKADTTPANLAEINDKNDSPVAETVLDSDALAIVALYNAWPAIHRLIVAVRDFADRRNKQADTFHQWAELWQALRALDDKEQRT